MFRDLQNGYTVAVLDKTGGVARYKSGTVKSVGFPRIDTRPNVPVSTERVVELVVEIDGQTLSYVVPEAGSIAVTENITMACDPSLMVNEVRAVMRRSEAALAAMENHRKNVEACRSILAEISPGYAGEQEQTRRLDSLEKTMADMNKAMMQFMEKFESDRTSEKKTKEK